MGINSCYWIKVHQHNIFILLTSLLRTAFNYQFSFWGCDVTGSFHLCSDMIIWLQWHNFWHIYENYENPIIIMSKKEIIIILEIYSIKISIWVEKMEGKEIVLKE